MKYSKVRNVKNPVRGTPKSAGIDFFVPEFNEKFIEDLKEKNPELNRGRFIQNAAIYLGPGRRVLIPSGIHVQVLENHALVVHNKSGVGSKLGLDKLAEVIDEDYQGEVHLNVVNTGTELVEITPNQKLVQMLLIPVNYSEPKQVPFVDLYKSKTERGEGGFGSTDENN